MPDLIAFADTLVRERPFVSLPLVFLSGVLMSFTPCFYPLIPVILGIIGVDKEISRERAFFLSLFFVLGMAVVYTAMGVASALTGTIFGQATKVALFQFIAAFIFFVMGLALLDVVPLPLSIPLNLRARKMGLAGAFVLGLIGALVIGGCTFPVLGSILTLMAFNKNLFLGGLLLFVFSLGLGALFILVAVFETRVLSFAKSKAGLFAGIKKLFGVSLIALAVYFIMRGVYLL